MSAFPAYRAVRGRWLALGAAVVAGLSLAAATPALAAPQAQAHNGFNQPDNILIADQFNNRIVEVNQQHQVVWQFGNGSYIPGPDSVVGPNDAERVGILTLISGTGTPAGADPSCPLANGCPDNRVMLVSPGGRIVWQYGKAGVTGSGPDELNAPVQSTWLPHGRLLITDQGNARVIEVNLRHQILWQYGMTGKPGSGYDQLNNPNSAELLPNGDVLIADESNNRVIEVNPTTKRVVWQYGHPSATSILNGAAFASRLPNGDTLISDSNNNRIVEVSMSKQVVFSYTTNTRPGSIANPLPTRAVRLRNGNTLISDQFNDQVIEVNPQGKIVFTQGMINTDGKGFDQLNAPYDAKVIGDYTGLTPP
jgi:hypothetical protein